MKNKWSPRHQSNYSAVQQQIEVPEQLEPTLTISVPSPSSTTNRFISYLFLVLFNCFNLVASHRRFNYKATRSLEQWHGFRTKPVNPAFVSRTWRAHGQEQHAATLTINFKDNLRSWVQLASTCSENVATLCHFERTTCQLQTVWQKLKTDLLASEINQ